MDKKISSGQYEGTIKLMNTDSIAISLTDESGTVAEATGHGGMIERGVISYLHNHPELTKKVLLGWKVANPGIDITMNGVSIDWTK